MWKFKSIERGFPEENPRETEFFRLRSPAESVVREFIQNSLDARKGGEIVKVKISLLEVHRKHISHFLNETLKQHLIACNLLSNHEYPQSVPFLLLEDYGTTGLDGPSEPDAGEGNFYNFWWRKGISQKSARKAGRWGLGKLTFHIVSKIRTFFGLTVRDDGRMFLMGKASLKVHKLNDKRYHYFGYFSKDDFTPFKDNDPIISSFKKNFGIIRNNNETGLSIVIPLPVDDIDFDSLLQSAIRHYFYPILAGNLIVEISGDGRDEELNGNTLIQKVSTIDWSHTEWEGINIKQILENVKEALQIPAFSLNIYDMENPKINDESFGEELRRLKQSFRQGNICKFKVPVRITKKDKQPCDTFFTVILKRIPGLKEAFESYVRSGILVSEIKMLGNRPVMAILVADDDYICEFLGDCETPAHTNWNERTEGFSEKYRNATRILRFIKKSMRQIVSILDEPPRSRQIDFLKEIFSVPVTPHETEEEEESTQRPEIPAVQRRLRIFNISQIQSGFTVTLDSQAISKLSFPFHAIIKIAYDTFRGNPFKQYEKFDFDVASDNITLATRDCNVLIRQENILEIEVTGRNFRLEVTGFDPRRDLVVDIKKR